MKKNIQLLVLSFLLFSHAFAQEVVFVPEFTPADLVADWTVTGGTFALTAENEMLKITYNRTASSGQWDQFALKLDNLDLSDSPMITLEVKSNVGMVLTLKPVNIANGDDWLQQPVPGNNEWIKYYFPLSASLTAPINTIYFYFDGGSSAPASGTVYFRNLYIGDSTPMPGDTTLLSSSIQSAILLMENITEGSENGQYPAGSMNLIQQAIVAAQAVLPVEDETVGQEELDAATVALNDALMNVESSVIYAENPLIDADATLPAIYLFKNLGTIANDKKYLFGMHDANSYGVGWTDNGTSNRSDVKDVTGSHPAVFSYDIAGIVGQSNPTLLRNQMLTAYNQGAVITLCWHQSDPMGRGFYYSDVNEEIVSKLLPGGIYHQDYIDDLTRLASFVKSLRGPRGEAIPILFRPYHEHNGNWFWWGKTRCTPANYNAIWQFTHNYLKNDLNVHNFIYVFSPDGNQYSSMSGYYEIYPGDEYVDVFGLDFYFGSGTTADVNKLRDRIKYISVQAKQKGKIAAITEAGDRLGWNGPDNLSIPNWYTRCIDGAIKGDPEISVAFMATWRNAGTTHHFAPYPGHKAVPDFLNFYDDTTTIFLNDLPDIHYSLLEGKVRKPSQSKRLVLFQTENSLNTVFSGKNVRVNVPEGTDVTSLIATFTASQGARVLVNDKEQISGVTANNFSSPVIYTVIAEDGITTDNYTVTIAFVSTTGLTGALENSGFLIYPNPSADAIFIENSTFESVTIFNSMGQQECIAQKISKGLTVIDVSPYARGIYFIRLENKNGNAVVQKILLQ
jgi:mannan endo-1,4-beta-mannosidase